MGELQTAIDHLLSAMAFKKARAFYEKSLEKGYLAIKKKEEEEVRTLLNSDVIVFALNEVAKLYREAEALAKKACTTLISAPSYDEAAKVAFEKMVEQCKKRCHLY